MHARLRPLSILFFLIILAALNACTAGKKTNSSLPPATPKPPATTNSKINIDGLIWFAKKWLGTPYKYASADPKNGGLDCSGFLNYVFGHFNIKLPRTTKDLFTYGKPVERNKAAKGQIVLFTGSNDKDKTAGHAGLITEIKDGDIHFIHASTSKGVMINKVSESYYAKRFLKIIDVLN